MLSVFSFLSLVFFVSALGDQIRSAFHWFVCHDCIARIHMKMYSTSCRCFTFKVCVRKKWRWRQWIHKNTNQVDSRLVVTFIFAFFSSISLTWVVSVWKACTWERNRAISPDQREIKYENGSIDETIERFEWASGSGREKNCARREFICVSGCADICKWKKVPLVNCIAEALLKCDTAWSCIIWRDETKGGRDNKKCAARQRRDERCDVMWCDERVWEWEWARECINGLEKSDNGSCLRKILLNCSSLT